MKKRSLRYIIFGLSCFFLSVAASIYMVFESSGYYRSLYSLFGKPEWMGWFTSILIEIMQLVLIAIISTKFFSNVFRCMVFPLVVVLFLISVYTAGMNLGNFLITQLEELESNDQIIEILKSELESLDMEFETFRSQNQKMNTAKTARDKREVTRKLREYITQKTNNKNSIRSQIIVLWCIKVAIQIANLICGHCCARFWSVAIQDEKVVIEEVKTVAEDKDIDHSPENKSEIAETHEIEKPERPKVVKKWKAKYTREEKGFIGILKLEDGSFIAIGPEGKRKYTTFPRALNFFNGSPYKEKINSHAQHIN